MKTEYIEKDIYSIIYRNHNFSGLVRHFYNDYEILNDDYQCVIKYKSLTENGKYAKHVYGGTLINYFKVIASRRSNRINEVTYTIYGTPLTMNENVIMIPILGRSNFWGYTDMSLLKKLSKDIKKYEKYLDKFYKGRSNIIFHNLIASNNYVFIAIDLSSKETEFIKQDMFMEKLRGDNIDFNKLLLSSIRKDLPLLTLKGNEYEYTNS